MKEDSIRRIVERNGSELLSYEKGRSAYLILSEKEQILISIGVATAKIFTRRFWSGWNLPKEIASKNKIEWQPDYSGFDALHHFACDVLLLDGLTSILSCFETIKEIKQDWNAIKNPIEEGAGFMFPSPYHNV